jgi:micrococcal nuclease
VVATGLKKALFMSAFLFLSLFVPTTHVAAETGEIRHVIDGDTVVLVNGRHLRLIGINAPELGKDGAPDQPLAREARARLVSLVEKRRVTLGFEREREDHYGRLLAHVYLPDGRDVEEILLREGLAWAVAVPPNIEKLAVLLAAENEVRGMGRGVWGEPGYALTPAERLTTQNTGFRFIEGTIRRRVQRHNVIYLDLTPSVALPYPARIGRNILMCREAQMSREAGSRERPREIRQTWSAVGWWRAAGSRNQRAGCTCVCHIRPW